MMTRHEIEAIFGMAAKIDELPRLQILALGEIAAQLADLNDTLRTLRGSVVTDTGEARP